MTDPRVEHDLSDSPNIGDIQSPPVEELRKSEAKITQLRKVAPALDKVNEALEQVRASIPPALTLPELPPIAPFAAPIPPQPPMPKPVIIPGHLAALQQVARYISVADKALNAGRAVADCLRATLDAHPEAVNAAISRKALENWDRLLG